MCIRDRYMGTMFIGLFYITSIPEEEETVFLVILIVINSVFLLYFIFFSIKATLIRKNQIAPLKTITEKEARADNLTPGKQLDAEEFPYPGQISSPQNLNESAARLRDSSTFLEKSKLSIRRDHDDGLDEGNSNLDDVLADGSKASLEDTKAIAVDSKYENDLEAKNEFIPKRKRLQPLNHKATINGKITGGFKRDSPLLFGHALVLELRFKERRICQAMMKEKRRVLRTLNLHQLMVDPSQ
eukprot:TRINITY_DN1868_c0_g1_i3.p1 TRINITY_DN1868_c0_g1~~TRINITY_DN1868_c0_g1_i3.p1  ORF type:complete len:242 (-),score=25.11 TRINITY_DN1868_c0_g1_i3:233-958(-)